MPAVRRKPEIIVGQIWIGRSKIGSPYTRRKITSVTDTHVTWELVGHCSRGAKSGVATLVSWKTWMTDLVQR